MKLLISEILDLIEKAKTKEEKKSLLKQYETTCMRGLMRINFDDTVSMQLPEGIPPFKKENEKPIGHSHTILEQEYRRFYIWLSPNQLSKTKREVLFVQLLESLHHTEAEVLCLIKDQNLRHKYPSITEKMIREVYIGLLPPKAVKEEVEDEFNFQNTMEALATISQIDEKVSNLTTTTTETKSDEVVIAPKKRGRPKKVK